MRPVGEHWSLAWIARIALAIALASCGGQSSPSPPPARVAALPPAPPPPHELSAPPFVLVLVDARTAQVFHVVDELSGWYPRAHSQYAAWAEREMPLDADEQALLARHAKLRAKRHWGSLDESFEVDATIDEAARAAVAKNLLSSADAETERSLLAHFETRLRPLLDSREAAVVAFETRLAAELPRAAALLAEFGRFCGVFESLPVRALLVPSPASAASEGRVTKDEIVLEIAPGGDASPPAPGETAPPAFFHHLAHVVLLQRRSTIAIAARKCSEALDDETFEEGLAYAFAPGVLRASDEDVLREVVERDRGASLRDPRVRAQRLGFALRAELGVALDGGRETLASFAPKVCDAWAKLVKP